MIHPLSPNPPRAYAFAAHIPPLTAIMSGWGWGSIFGGSGNNSREAPKNAILGLRSTLEMLTKRDKHLQNQMDEQDAIARKNVNANKGRK